MGNTKTTTSIAAGVGLPNAFQRALQREFRVGMWIRRTENEAWEHVVQDVAADTTWAAVGCVVLHMRTTDPDVVIQPKGISVRNVAEIINKNVIKQK